MNTAIAIGRARTMLSNMTNMLSSDPAAHVWASVRPKLNLSRDMMASANRKSRFAKNVLAADLPSPTTYLEIGSFEGGSLAFINALLNGRINATCIDPFENYGELPTTDMSDVEARFRANIRAIGADVRILRGSSLLHLPQLISANEKFHLIYIDGSHAALDVMTDAILCWRLLESDGLMIFDDYHFDGCRSAIRSFVGLVKQEASLVDVADQLFLRRR